MRIGRHYIAHDVTAKGVLCYEPRGAGDRLAVFLNMTARPARAQVPARLEGSRLVISTDVDRRLGSLSTQLELDADEGVVAVRA